MLPAVLHINPASHWQRGFLLSTHTAALLNVWWLDWQVALPLSVLVIASLGWQWCQQPAITSIQCLPDGQLAVATPIGEQLIMDVLPSSLLTAHVLVLHLRGDERKLHVVIWPDSCDAEVRRQWRVYLRWIWPNFHREKKSDLIR